MKNVSFEFSIGFDSEIEYVSPYDETPEKECEEILKKVINNDKIIVGERSEGHLDIVDDVVTLDYRWCSDVGEDWNDDVWNDEFEYFSYSEIE